jgi:hypothetical protein
LNEEVWQFAIEVAELHKTGVTNTDLRWLLAEGYAEHGRERTKAGACRASRCLFINWDFLRTRRTSSPPPSTRPARPPVSVDNSERRRSGHVH